jgi:sarcosine oxidase subunit gamma
MEKNNNKSHLLFDGGEDRRLSAHCDDAIIEVAAWRGANAKGDKQPSSDGAFAEARAILAEKFNLPMPEGYRSAAESEDGKTAVLQTAPRRLLIIAAAPSSVTAAAIAAAIAGNAAAAEQSAAYQAFHIQSAAFARDLLARGLPIDLHPDEFPPLAFARTVINHTTALIINRAAAFAVYVPRSYAAATGEWLKITAAAAGKQEE